ncbi:MAG: AlkA N-terminal domain-containing protein [Phenylobacterium sp.]|uniref:AlkA N-terminal domain-containing protein n=1 Tax=Phenylobacterium sp. TaxID=1871053 RepID=UPI00301AC711
MDLDTAASFRAFATRDGRLDGRLFGGVITTGIYCRPVCPARKPKPENVRFFSSAAAAQHAGFRPCLRCRPETAPELGAWNGTANTVSRALALIDLGALDTGDLQDLTRRLGVGERHLRRLFQEHLGASPVSVAQTRRLLMARRLILETGLSMSEVALASGFGSIRRFNEAFQAAGGSAPSSLRERSGAKARLEDGVTLRLTYRPPYDWPRMLDFFAQRQVAGVESIDGQAYVRTLAVGGFAGVVRVEPGRGDSLSASLWFPDLRVLPRVLAQVRRVFDLALDPEPVLAHLGEDPDLGPLLAQRPGLRAPGAWDGFELAVRAILGQQVSVTAARGLAGRLAERHGVRLDFEPARRFGLDRLFPGPERLAGIDPESLPMPRARGRALAAIAQVALEDGQLFGPGQDLESAVRRLTALPGIGAWTAQYIAMRALREPDAFPHSDLALLRAAADPEGRRPSPEALLARAEAWRPWRAYAAAHLWAKDADAASHRKGHPE